MSWSNDYIDLPFKIGGRDRSGVDCWGLVRLVYSDLLKIELPSIDGVFVEEANTEQLQRIAYAMEEESRRWQEVNKPQEFDVVLLRRGKLACHVGVAVSSRHFLHITEGICSTVEPMNGLRWGKRIVGFYRYVNQSTGVC